MSTPTTQAPLPPPAPMSVAEAKARLLEAGRPEEPSRGGGLAVRKMVWIVGGAVVLGVFLAWKYRSRPSAPADGEPSKRKSNWGSFAAPFAAVAASVAQRAAPLLIMMALRRFVDRQHR